MANLTGAATDTKEALKKAREESVEVLLTSLEQVRPLLQEFHAGVAGGPSLINTLREVNASCQRAIDYKGDIDKLAKKVAAYPESINTRLVDPIFSAGKIWPLFFNSCLIALLAIGTVLSSRFLAMADDHFEELMESGDRDAKKGVSAFWTDVSDLDTTTKERLTRPFQRSWIRLTFLCKYARGILIYMIFLVLAVIALITHLFNCMLDAGVMYFVVTAMGDVCSDSTAAALLTNEDQCAAPFRDISAALDGVQILPGGSCAAAGLLVCPEFFQPVSSMLYWDLVLKLIAVIGVTVISFQMPGEIRETFSRQVELHVRKKAKEGLPGLSE